MRSSRSWPRAGVWAGGGLLVLFALGALLAGVLAPFDPTLPSGRPLLAPDTAHLLGTNDLGQDILSQWLFGARVSLGVALGVGVLSTAISWIVGLSAGFWRVAEWPLMAVTDLLLSLPSLPLYLLLMALVGPSQLHLILVLSALAWPAFARVVRAQMLAGRGAPHVEAARALGATPAGVLRVHLFPATVALLTPQAILVVRYALFAEATLAFLGLGDRFMKSWGAMLGAAFADPLLFSRPTWVWLVAPPALAIALVVLGVTWLATGLEERAA